MPVFVWQQSAHDVRHTESNRIPSQIMLEESIRSSRDSASRPSRECNIRNKHLNRGIDKDMSEGRDGEIYCATIYGMRIGGGGRGRRRREGEGRGEGGR